MFYLNSNFSELYTFEVYAPGQQYAIYHFDSGHWSVLANGFDPNIQTGSSPTQLKIEVSDGVAGSDLYSFVIGGSYLGFSLQLPPADRRVGLVASADDTGFDARFDDYTFSGLTCHAALAGPDAQHESGFLSAILMARPRLSKPLTRPTIMVR
jgi:hypothetical protein